MPPSKTPHSRRRLSLRGNQRGSALLMALFTSMVLIVLATEIMYQTTVEAKVSAQGVNQIKAYYAAKAGVELGLFRVYLYRKVVAQVGDALPDKTMLDLIWNFPFAWPPPVPDEIGMVAKDQIEKSVKASNMKAQYTISIESEGSKIDINDLASPSKVVATAVREQILQLYQSKIETDEKFAERYRNYDFNKMVNNLTDWVDENTESLNGGDEKSLYQDVRNDFIPPNQPFKTISEIHMVEGMTDDLFEVIVPRITVYGSKGINVNYASKEILRSLSRSITTEVADKIVEARSNPTRGPFKNMEDFTGYLGSLGVDAAAFLDGKEEKIPLIFDAEYNFRIRAVGKSGPVIREIQAITYDIDSVKQRLGDLLKKQAEKDKGANGEAQTPPNPPDPTQPPGATPPADPNKGKQEQKKKIEIPKERPNVVYWIEA